MNKIIFQAIKQIHPAEKSDDSNGLSGGISHEEDKFAAMHHEMQ